MRWLALVLLSGLFWLQASVTLAAPVAETLKFGGDIRNYWLYRPEGLDKAKPAPLLLVLHGSAGSGEDMMTVTQRGFERLADKEKFLVVYPDALERRWNDLGGTADDVGFLLAIVDKLATDGLVDKSRVYAAGISNGGMMAQRLACEQADRLAGIATVAGGLPTGLAATCKPARPLPVLVIHGSEDPIVPWSGGAVAGFEEFGNVMSARDTAKFWAVANQCKESGSILPEPDRDPHDGMRVRLESFIGCPAQAAVTLVAVEHGGHTWPGGYQYLPERFIGKTTKDIDANSVIWNFFKGVTP
jgi:polyhydroxybutyrate depolymerase